jgi:hypothetical protein
MIFVFRAMLPNHSAAANSATDLDLQIGDQWRGVAGPER